MKMIYTTALLASALSGAAALQIDNSEATLDTIADLLQEQNDKLDAQNDKLGEQNEELDRQGVCNLDTLDYDAEESTGVATTKEEILRHALWVETYLIPRDNCRVSKGDAVWAEIFPGFGCYRSEDN